MRIDPGVTEEPFNNATVLHIRRQKAQRHLRDLTPGDGMTITEWGICGDEQPVTFSIQRNRGHAPERFIVEIGKTRVDLEIFEMGQNRSMCVREQ